MIHIGIVDDNAFLTTAIAEKLSLFGDLKIVFTATDGRDVWTRLQEGAQVDILLMDIEMPGMNGIDTTEKIKNRFPHIKIIMLTVMDNDEHIFQSIQAGADGYLLKEVQTEVLYDSIIQTLAGGAAMTPSIAMKTLKLLRNPMEWSDAARQEPAIRLSAREVEILEQIAKGLTAKMIADNLYLSSGTVRKHIENIYEKLQVHSKVEAVEKARKNRLI